MSLSLNIRALGYVTLKRQLLFNFPALSMGSVRAYSDDVKNKDLATTVTQKTTSTMHRGRLGLTDHRVNRLEKYLLVWGGKYKTVNEVPDLVGQDTLERARNKARIKINLMMVAATLVGCLVMVYSGKKARDAGESVIKMNEDWHRKINEEAIAKKMEIAKKIREETVTAARENIETGKN